MPGRADSPGDRDVYVSPGPADAEGYPGGEAPRAGQTAYEEETLDAILGMLRSILYSVSDSSGMECPLTYATGLNAVRFVRG